MIIAVGFKVNNERAVQFRKWANGIVKDYTIKGWVMDDERLKNGGSVLTTEYFDRLLEQIREIRLSERRFYQKITDIYATALDYDQMCIRDSLKSYGCNKYIIDVIYVVVNFRKNILT